MRQANARLATAFRGANASLGCQRMLASAGKACKVASNSPPDMSTGPNLSPGWGPPWAMP